MSTLAIVAIAVGALIVLAILVAAARRSARRREFGQAQTEASTTMRAIIGSGPRSAVPQPLRP